MVESEIRLKFVPCKKRSILALCFVNLRYGKFLVTMTSINHSLIWTLSFALPQNVLDILHNTFIPLSFPNQDKLLWGLTSNGSFSTSSCYQFLASSEDSNASNLVSHSNKKFLNKIKTFLCLSQHGRLPTGQYLNGTGLNVPPSCSFCGNASESIPYIFFECTNDILF